MLRQGLFLGEIKKNRFEPSQSLAMYLKQGQFDNEANLTLTDDRVLRYLERRDDRKHRIRKLKNGYACSGGTDIRLMGKKNTNGTLKRISIYLDGDDVAE